MSGFSFSSAVAALLLDTRPITPIVESITGFPHRLLMFGAYDISVVFVDELHRQTLPG